MESEIIHGDCILKMADMEPDSIDAIVTDPPYGLEFMGKEWDAHPDLPAYQAWTTNWATQAFRVLKPGGSMLAFGGTRTFHRLACGLEDAGWTLKDTLCWLYGSGKGTRANKGRGGCEPPQTTGRGSGTKTGRARGGRK